MTRNTTGTSGERRMRLLLLGATGLVGSRTLDLALSSLAIAEVIAPTRTPLEPRLGLTNPVTARLEDVIPLLSRTSRTP